MANERVHRYRRLRQSPTIRNLIRETVLTANDLIQPFFVIDGKKRNEAISSMPGISRFSCDLLLKEIGEYVKAGGQAGLFFSIPTKKNASASEAYSSNGVLQKAIKAVKKEFPQFYVITDVCLCGFTDHGHCGIVENAQVDNDKTLAVLGDTAVSHAQAGADIVAPSGMMDFCIQAIRRDLDKSGFINTGIMSYAVKYASVFYGPFREAAHSAAKSGDRKSYQMDPANKREALKEAQMDVCEGADIVMVKPAVPYLDIVSLLREKLNVPIAAYHVSGEYSMIKAAVQRKWVDERSVVLETLCCIKRAGADIVISYHAKDVLEWIKKT